MYSPQLLEHFEHPRNVGEVKNPSAVAEVRNPACGDVLRVSLLVERDRIVQARFKAKGCVPSIACASMLTELLAGRLTAEAAQLSAQDLEKALGGLPSAGHHASELAIDALRAALNQLPK